MTDKNKNRKPYGKFMRSLFWRTLLFLCVSGCAVIAVRIIFAGKMANNITRIICAVLNIGWEQGVQFYRRHIGSNQDFIMIISAIALFFIMFRISLSWFGKYFKLIVEGIENLADESEEAISMPRELYFVEEKLNESKYKLEKRAQDAKQAEQRKDELVVYLAHDIKTPLTSVIGYLSLISQTEDMEEEQKAAYVKIALDKAYRLEFLINEFFEITRYNAKGIDLKIEEVNLSCMMSQVAGELYPSMSDCGKSIVLDIPEDIFVCVDTNKMARVFNNILKNAISYGESNREISVKARKSENETYISFENHGEIPEDKLNNIFEKFYRLDASRGSRTGGAGLGLAIAKEIVELHKGKIYAKSLRGKTCFTVELPPGISA